MLEDFNRHQLTAAVKLEKHLLFLLLNRRVFPGGIMTSISSLTVLRSALTRKVTFLPA